MHPEAHAWVARHATTEIVAVLEIGGRNINGTVRDLFPSAGYVTLDLLPGDDVDIVADAATWTPDRGYDVIVCTEVFEHTPDWPQIIRTAFAALRPGGCLIATMAGPGRAPHSAFDGGPTLAEGEHYANVGPAELLEQLTAAGFAEIVVDFQPGPADTRCVAVRPEVTP
jgi:SAM-dependent methyltransferase